MDMDIAKMLLADDMTPFFLHMHLVHKKIFVVLNIFSLITINTQKDNNFYLQFSQYFKK